MREAEVFSRMSAAFPRVVVQRIESGAEAGNKCVVAYNDAIAPSKNVAASMSHLCSLSEEGFELHMDLVRRLFEQHKNKSESSALGYISTERNNRS